LLLSKGESSGNIWKNDLQKEKKIENRKNNQSEFDGSEEQLTDCPTVATGVILRRIGVRRRRKGRGSERGGGSNNRRRGGLGCCDISIDGKRKNRMRIVSDGSRSRWSISKVVNNNRTRRKTRNRSFSGFEYFVLSENLLISSFGREGFL
jgi:hypothetical protein